MGVIDTTGSCGSDRGLIRPCYHCSTSQSLNQELDVTPEHPGAVRLRRACDAGVRQLASIRCSVTELDRQVVVGLHHVGAVPWTAPNGKSRGGGSCDGWR